MIEHVGASCHRPGDLTVETSAKDSYEIKRIRKYMMK